MDSLLHELNGMLYIARAALLSPYEACRITSIISIITAISWPSSYIWHCSMNTMHKIIQAQINFAIILTPLLVTPSRPWCGVGLLTLFRPHRWGKKLKLIQSIHRNQMSNYPCAILQNVTHSPGRGKGKTHQCNITRSQSIPASHLHIVMIDYQWYRWKWGWLLNYLFYILLPPWWYVESSEVFNGNLKLGGGKLFIFWFMYFSAPLCLVRRNHWVTNWLDFKW